MDKIEAYWQDYLATLPAGSPVREEPYTTDSYGDSPEMATELGALIAAGRKTASCSAWWEWEAEGKPFPSSLDGKAIVLDGDGEPLCIIESTDLFMSTYDAIDAGFAAEEGEGDLSLDYWRKEHREVFSRILSKIGREFAPDMPLVCERFRVVYKK